MNASALLTIDLAALRANWRLLAENIAPAECAAVVKADAYGIGLEPAGRALFAEGARTFFVARLDEAIRLRAILPNATIYVLDGLLGDVSLFVAHDLRPVLGSADDLREWGAVESAKPPAGLQIDTGMNRLGLPLADIAATAALRGKIKIALVMSHFTSSENIDAADNFTQFERFRSVAQLAPKASLANSSGIFLGWKPWFDLVRPGYALYGGNPTPDAPNPMRSVVTLEAPILQVRNVGAGETVGYNNQWTARKPSRIATVALGYADGIPRGAANTDTKPGPEVAILGQRCPIAGRISMDLITVDVTGISQDAAHRGAMVEFVGPTIGIDEFGSRAGTIGYEILTSLGTRYARRYVGG